MIFDEKKYQHLFTAGNYPQGNFTIEILREIADGYDPLNFHEAPVWRGHPLDVECTSREVVDEEPKALAWVKNLTVVGDKLYGLIEELTDEFSNLVIKNKSFKKVSVELRQRMIDGVLKWYLFAVGLTNRPAVSGLESLSFSGHKLNNTWSEGKFIFEQNFSNYNKSTMNESLKKVAVLFGLDLSKFTTESSLLEAISIKFNEMKTPVAGGTGAPDNSIANLQSEIDILKQERVDGLIDGAIKAFKILPADKQKWTDMAKANFNITKNAIDALGTHKDLTDKTIKDVKVDMTDSKFKGKDGKELTYTEYLKLDVAEQKNFTDEEVTALRNKSQFKR